MKTIRKIAHSPLFIFFLITNFLFVSCSSDLSNNNDLEKLNTDLGVASKTKSFTDEDVFKGVIFFEGEVAEKMGSYKDLNFRTYTNKKSDIDKALKFQKEILNLIKIQNPNFLSNFRLKIGSGNFYVVKEAFNDAFAKVTEATSSLTNISKENLESTAKKILSDNNINGNTSKIELVKKMKKLNSDNNTDSKRAIIDIWIGIYIAADRKSVV